MTVIAPASARWVAAPAAALVGLALGVAWSHPWAASVLLAGSGVIAVVEASRC